MPKKILGFDEVERIAKEYVQHKENVSDVEVTGTKPSSVEELPIHVVQGSARKHSMSSTFCDAVIAERSFRLWISAKDGKIIDYWPGDWVYKNVEQASPSYSQPEQIIIEPVEFLRTKGPFEDVLDSRADRGLKEAQAEKERAKAHYYEEKAKSEKRNKPPWRF